jgi:hypothetical protein
MSADSAASAATVTSSGQILMPEVSAPKEPVQDVPGGSMSDVAVKQVQQSISTHAEAIKVMPSKAGRRSRRAVSRRSRRKYKGGASEVTVHPPTFVSAGTGSTSANAAYAKLLQVQHQQAANSVYDSLGSAAPMKVAAGRKKLSKKHKHGRRSTKNNSKTRRHGRSSRHLSASRRRHSLRLSKSHDTK